MRGCEDGTHAVAVVGALVRGAESAQNGLETDRRRESAPGHDHQGRQGSRRLPLRRLLRWTRLRPLRLQEENVRSVILPAPALLSLTTSYAGISPGSAGQVSRAAPTREFARMTLFVAGFDVPEIDRELITKRLSDEFSCIPVYLSAEVAERYYNGFSNSILWPLFHCASHRTAFPVVSRALTRHVTPNRPSRRDYVRRNGLASVPTSEPALRRSRQKGGRIWRHRLGPRYARATGLLANLHPDLESQIIISASFRSTFEISSVAIQRRWARMRNGTSRGCSTISSWRRKRPLRPCSVRLELLR